MPNVILDTNLFLFPDCDLALLKCPPVAGRAYVALEYGDILTGTDVAFAGFPANQLGQDQNGAISYAGALFRVGKGVVTSRYKKNLTLQNGAPTLTDVPIVEVNFMFLPGNSGGPVFNIENGRVFGFVHGFTAAKLREKVETVTLIPNFPADMEKRYVENLNAVYSIAIKLDRVRPHLEAHAVTL